MIQTTHMILASREASNTTIEACLSYGLNLARLACYKWMVANGKITDGENPEINLKTPCQLA